MKRYDIELPDDAPHREWPWPLREDEDGDWVEFEEAWKLIKATEAVVNNAIKELASVLDLTIPDREQCDPVQAIALDIRRLREVEKRWLNACDLARLHCPVGDGENHIKQGIPRLAERARVAEEEVERLRRLLPPGAGRSEGGVGEGSWSVFAEKAVEERDAAIARAERMRAEIARYCGECADRPAGCDTCRVPAVLADEEVGT
jgi:hypothetical protein